MPEQENNIAVEETEESVEPGEESEGSEEDFTPPSRDEWTRLANAAKVRKKERDDARRELASLKKKDVEEEKPDEAAKWRETAARASAATALQGAGFSGSAKQARRLTRLLDLAATEPDDMGDFDFEDEIEELKSEFPQLFSEKKPSAASTRRPTTADRGGNSDGPSRDMTTERMLKMAGYR
ncbi:hypothetical protein GCM10017691_23940 [Pseudonocardia petroleophila]|uniref:Scaffolding protein n=1 Tax=Pseudonocardia petroleophila TaxID=37331 RepID=A0A7G7MFU9_9PSEU|nr:hypothetical protein [Pseudonocardia petroleophila]QNG51660.1 hypothetical protein H6H00_26730 [Pseudonocardia petroleophila]